MLFLTRFSILAQAAPDLGFVESIFFKILGLTLMILWVVYLVKDIFFAHKSDPRLESLITGMGQTNVQLATITANLQHLSEAVRQQQQRELSTQATIEGIRRSLTTLAEDHAGLAGALDAPNRRPH